MDAGDMQEDVALLLAIKDAEITTLRQQMSQLTDDLKRNLAVLAAKDAEATKQRNTVDALRALLAEKDNLFAEFQEQVRELEGLRLKEVEQRTLLEQQLAAKQQEWQCQQAAGQQDREADAAALQQQLAEAEEKCAAQLVHVRQAALDDSIRRSTQHEAALQRAVEEKQQLQQQVEQLLAALGVKESELEAAHRQLGSALESNQKLEVTHAKVVSSKEDLIAQLQQRADQLVAGNDTASAEHDTNMHKLISSLQQMQESCQAQAAEVQEYACTQKQLHDERRVLKEHLRQQEAIITKLQTEKGVLEAALQHEVAGQASAQAHINIFQARLSEAVVELERRCAAAESKTSALMAQLVEERGRLVDAVIEQANSSTPQLAAELAKSLEADRMRTQTELQMAQERSKSLAEELSLIRSTLLPLLPQQQNADVRPAMSGSPTQAANGALAALALMVQQQQQPLPRGMVGADTYNTSPRAGDNAAAAAAAAVTTERATRTLAAEATDEAPWQHSMHTPGVYATAINGSGSVTSSPTLQTGSPSRGMKADGNGNPMASTGSLAGLVSGLQADVDKLQRQLHSSRRQLKWPALEQHGRPDGVIVQNADALPPEDDRCPSPASSTAYSQQQLPYDGAGCSGKTRHEDAIATASPVAMQQQQVHETLRYLLEHTEHLSAANATLQAQLQGASPDRAGRSAGHSRHPAGTVQHSSRHGHQSLQPSKHRICQNNRSCASAAQKQSNKRMAAAVIECISAARDGPFQAVQQALQAARGDLGRQQQRQHSSSVPGDDGEDVGSELSSSWAGSMAGGDEQDLLDMAACEELAAAAAVSAAEGPWRRRQARAAAAAAAGRSPGSTSRLEPCTRGRALTQVDEDCTSVVSDDSVSNCSRVLAALASSPRRKGASTKQLLESALASLPANHKLGKLIQDIIAVSAGAGDTAAGHRSTPSGKAAAAAAAADSQGSSGSSSSRRRCEEHLMREQLQRLVNLSPGRQRLRKALAQGP